MRAVFAVQGADGRFVCGVSGVQSVLRVGRAGRWLSRGVAADQGPGPRGRPKASELGAWGGGADGGEGGQPGGARGAVGGGEDRAGERGAEELADRGGGGDDA